MPRRSLLLELPDELLVLIVGYLQHVRDIDAVTKLNRRFRAISSDLIVDLAVANYVPSRGRFREGSDRAFVEAVRYDSSLMMQVLMSISVKHDLKKYGEHGRRAHVIWDARGPLFDTLPLDGVTKGYSLAALLHDAPHVASQLLEKGAKLLPLGRDNALPIPGYQHRVPGYFLVFDEVERFQDLIPLLLALEKPGGIMQDTLNAALRIACCYQWPRTVSYILTHGADPNAIGRNGTAAIHHFALELNRVAIDKRNIPLPYRERPSSEPSFAILSALLTFGADPKLMTQSSRYQGPQVHACRPRGCLSHGGQTPLHLAAAAGLKECVELLIGNGALLEPLAIGGNTRLRTGLVHGLEYEFMWPLMTLVERNNPPVFLPRQGAVLYIAHRFAHDLAVNWVIKRRRNADSMRSPPLRKVLDVSGQDRMFDLAFTIGRVSV